MSEGWEWTENTTKLGMPTAVLRHADKVVARIYESSDGTSLRIVLPEFVNSNQLSFKPGGIIDFRRQP